MKRFFLRALGAMGLLSQLATLQATEPLGPPKSTMPPIISRSEALPESSPAVDDSHHDNDGGRGWHLFGGADALYVRPYFSSNPALAIATTKSNSTITAGPVTATVLGFQGSLRSNPEFDYEFTGAPRLWLGVESECGVGFRARFFRFDQNAHPLSTPLTGSVSSTTVSAGATATTINTSNSAVTASSAFTSTGLGVNTNPSITFNGVRFATGDNLF